MAPVVEVPGNDDWQVARGELLEPPGDRFQLARAATLVQRQVHAHAVQIAPPPGDGDDAVEQAAALIAVVGDVLVLERYEPEARKDRVAMVAVVVHRIAAVGVLPILAGEE